MHQFIGFVRIRKRHIDKCIACLSVVAVVFFSYIPFLYAFRKVSLEKYSIFVLLIAVIFVLILFGHFAYLPSGGMQFYKTHITAISLYVSFALYVLVSYITIGEKLNDFFTIRTLALVNPIFAILAVSSTKNKNSVICMMSLFSGVYFAFLFVSLIGSDISPGSDSFQSIFMDIEGGLYQNINTYLGLFVICNVFFLSFQGYCASIIPRIVIPLTVAGMFMIGGRSSVVALAVVLLIYAFNESNVFSLKVRGILVKIISCAVVASLVIVYYVEISNFLQALITWRRFATLMEEGDTSERLFLFSKAIELFFVNAKSMLFGAGINSFPVHIGYNTTEWYPHNIVLELLAEYGIVGSILFALCVGYVLVLRKKKLGSIYGSSIYEKIVFLFFVYYLVIHLFSSGLRASWVLVFFLFLSLPGKGFVEEKI